MSETERVIDDLNVSKLMLCNPKMLTSEMCVRIGQAINGAIDLLKEPEAVEPTVSGAEEHDGLRSWWYQCGKCKTPIDYGDRFCRHCGQEVKWK